MQIRHSILAASIVSLLSLPLFGANSSLVQSPLVNTGVDADAAGRVLASLTAKRSEMIVQVSKLAPSAAYTIEVDGIVQGEFTTGKSGSASVKFRGPEPKRGLALDFDPRGKLLRVLADNVSVLEATLSADGEVTGAVVVERVNLALGAADGVAGKAKAEYRLDKKGRRTFKVEVERAGEGPFELFVGGIKRSELITIGQASKIKFAIGSDDADVLPLDFDPRGQVIDIIRSGQTVFSSELAALALGVNVASPRLSRSGLPSTGVDPDGHAEAKLRIDDRARKHFSVEVEDVAPGTYDLLVDGVDVADIVVVTTPDGTEGEVEFTSGDDDSDELPLTFDPAGKTLTIRQGAVVFFEGLYTPATGSGTGTPAPEPASETEEFLASSGLDSDASARARYRVDDRGRHKFSVEIEDVAAGEYSLVVAGTVRGTIRAALVDGSVEGEIEFSSKSEPGHRTLNFDPRGQLIEIVNSTGTFFSHILGSGSASGGTGGSGGGGGGGGGTNVVPEEITRPLLSTGVDSNGSAKAELKVKASGQRSFEVEVEDVNAGNYELVVGGTVRGVITVINDDGDTRGKIEFESEPKAGDELFNFEVKGQEIIIRKDATVFFSRVFE